MLVRVGGVKGGEKGVPRWRDMREGGERSLEEERKWREVRERERK